MEFLQVQVAYNQGLVKIFVAEQETLLKDFVTQARRFGRIKVMRFMPNVDKRAADLLIETGNATMIGGQDGEAKG